MTVVQHDTTRLERATATLCAPHPELSGLHLLRDPLDAFAARYLLAKVAERILDVQYYMWHKDLSGTLLFQALLDAADRGVQVRLLLDDNNTSGLDNTLAMLDAHPHIAVRLFNPFFIRKPRILGYLTDFFRANRRMHNKSFTADGKATIIGGRNVGDEYFGATKGLLFADLDVLAIGPVVEEVTTDFERYWTSASAFPVSRVIPPAAPDSIAAFKKEAAEAGRKQEAVGYLDRVRDSEFFEQFVEGSLELEWAPTRMISDDPAKGLGRAALRTTLPEKLKKIFGEPGEGVDLVSAYFVPTVRGVASFSGWAKRGVRVRILTNSLEATDVAAVHAGYSRHRPALLASGIALYELRRSSRPRKTARLGRRFGSSGSSLHAKAFAVDQSRAFIGSFNFDPRSASLNTEMGFVIESPSIARQLAEAFEKEVPLDAYEVKFSDTGRLHWIEQRDGKAILHHTEPGTSWLRRACVRVLSLLPIDGLL